MKNKLKYIIGLTAIITIYSLSAKGQSTVSGIINNYAQVTAIDTICQSTLTLQSATGFKTGDTVLIMQMKGATIDTSNTVAFGSIKNLNNTGNYERAFISGVNSNSVTLKFKLLKKYDVKGIVQLVRVPFYAGDVTVTGTLTAKAWDGITGGVLALEVGGTLTINAGITINADGLGSKGGLTNLNTGSSSSNTGFYYSFSAQEAGNKGEGIASLSANYVAGRGVCANGGGGGNGNGAGGGGGANYGTGGTGGGQTYLQVLANGGIGGTALTYSNVQNRVFLGGGGGGGFQNNACGTDGAPGGGVIIIKANSLNGNAGSITANGIKPLNSTCNDGVGGGGAGGTILLDVQNYTSNLNVITNGGNGANAPNTGDGPGGGGGGGVLWVSGASLSPNITYTSNGGLKGTNNSTGNGTQPGTSGGSVTGLQIPQSSVNPVKITPVVSGNATLCLGQKTVLISSGASTYSWSPITGLNQSTGDSIIANPTKSTVYTITGKDANGCSGTATVAVTVNVPTGVQVGPDVTINAGDSKVLNGVGIGTFKWTPSTGLSCTDCPNPTAEPLVSTSYFVTLTDSNGCLSSDTIFVDVHYGEVFIPTAFSPNGDQVNDVLYVRGSVFKDFDFLIFDRWGNKVFETTDIKTGWDGTFHGKKMDPSVFVYSFKGTTYIGQEISKKGNISLIR